MDARHEYGLFVVKLAKNFITIEIVAIAYAKSVIALLTGKAVQVVNVASGLHDHLERWNDLGTSGTRTSCSKQT